MSTSTPVLTAFPADTPPPCHLSPALFHAPDGPQPESKNARGDRVAEAIDLCLECPVMLACRQWARSNGVPGVAGGETEEERAAAGYPPEVEPVEEESGCGTEGAARRHRRRGEPLDAACAAAEYLAARKRRCARDAALATQWPPHLTPREQDVLRAYASGMGRAGIATKLKIPRRGVAKYMYLLRQRLRVTEDCDLVEAAHLAGVLPARSADYARAA